MATANASLERLRWVTDAIANRSAVNCNVSYNNNSCTYKLHIRIYEEYSDTTKTFAENIIHHAHHLAATHVLTDKGHFHEGVAMSSVVFYFKKRPLSPSADDDHSPNDDGNDEDGDDPHPEFKRSPSQADLAAGPRSSPRSRRRSRSPPSRAGQVESLYPHYRKASDEVVLSALSTQSACPRAQSPLSASGLLIHFSKEGGRASLASFPTPVSKVDAWELISRTLTISSSTSLRRSVRWLHLSARYMKHVHELRATKNRLLALANVLSRISFDAPT
eukprot:TRINITY_DN65904_c0_g1_i1.p1 TRINITY_DN65904_c0_g1~~TRINITY_DN65904_c0_g1_i1.p1  ORF type:complete len:300 (-),score=13.68 TRINITY_DN65904_c0_g1_i1:191-1018(-)